MMNPIKVASLKRLAGWLGWIGAGLVVGACGLLATPTADPPAAATPLETAAASPTAAPAQATLTPVEEAPAEPAGPVEVCDPPLRRTVPNPEGPFYKPNAPERTSLADPGMAGTRLVVTGQVLTPDCQPVAGAELDFWQTDAQGNYDNEGFQFRGRQVADEAGRYRLETILPGEYPGRPAHIHVKVNPPGGAVLTTQIYFSGQASNSSDGLIHPSLLADLETSPEGVLQAEFNFVLSPQ